MADSQLAAFDFSSSLRVFTGGALPSLSRDLSLPGRIPGPRASINLVELTRGKTFAEMLNTNTLVLDPLRWPV